MSWLEAIILGIVQGLTEFLPVSSSAHVSIVGQVFGADPGAAFTAIMQIGTETAVVVYFRKKIWRILSRWCLALFGKIPQADPDVRLGWLVIVGSIPIVVLGLVLEPLIEGPFRNLWVTIAMLAGVGVLIGIGDRFSSGTKTLDDIGWRDGIIFGLAQACALVPGVSRSGGTITAGLFMGYKRKDAAEYSFLLAIPAVFGSGFYSLTNIAEEPDPNWTMILVATVIAFVIGLAVTHWLMRYISHNSFLPFVIYRVVLAAGLAILLLAGLLPPYTSA
ncbi:undecaprenyl-diphosphate phosphatase [Naumannella halotolerans]|uniref:Undecaprenyl-diphosphatase n=1 Tax=Naumannella halotolerans TaxID=993414 RepID=A0A4R7J732_9ACTN|nr:undecaprenyl-diphosphate phosphatase [Naumannella halotolerans]TDT33064.1 undecaprenyl-diphosphatase [Naumannella halotolerans]